MTEPISVAPYVGEIIIGDVVIPCAVLEDGTRLITQQGFLQAIGRAAKAKGGQGASVDNKVSFLAAKNLNPFISDELRESTKPIIFRTSKGIKAFGYQANLLPEVCNVYLSANDAGVLLGAQKHILRACEIMIRGLARVGIAALIDEATGYQEVRDKQALSKILEKYIRDQYAKWTKTFPDDFYIQMFRLKGWQIAPLTISRPAIIGKYTNDIIYDRLAPGVLKELQKKNPVTEKGYRKERHHQWLTGEIGHPQLKEHLIGVVALMKASKDWDSFLKMIKSVYPRMGDQISMDLDAV